MSVTDKFSKSIMLRAVRNCLKVSFPQIALELSSSSDRTSISVFNTLAVNKTNKSPSKMKHPKIPKS